MSLAEFLGQRLAARCEMKSSIVLQSISGLVDAWGCGQLGLKPNGEGNLLPWRLIPDGNCNFVRLRKHSLGKHWDGGLSC